MKVADQVLEQLENHRGSFLSGGELARNMGVSRNAVWKAIHQLQEQGYPILSQKQGYQLETGSTVMSRQSIEKYITEPKLRIQVFDQVTSTNLLLKEQADQGVEEGMIYVANEQTAGRGRRGRSFFSPADTGIYTSILLRPNLSVSEALKITTTAAVATARALEKNFHQEMSIKWVNDIFCNGKKVCGILSEASLDMETGGLSYVILGIGINISTPKQAFDDEVRKVAGSLMEDNKTDTSNHLGDLRSKIAADLWNEFWRLYQNLSDQTIWQEYQKRMMWLGEEIDLVDGNGERTPARLLGLNPDYSLTILHEDGSVSALSSGEISIRIHEKA